MIIFKIRYGSKKPAVIMCCEIRDRRKKTPEQEVRSQVGRRLRSSTEWRSCPGRCPVAKENGPTSLQRTTVLQPTTDNDRIQKTNGILA